MQINRLRPEQKHLMMPVFSYVSDSLSPRLTSDNLFQITPESSNLNAFYKDQLKRIVEDNINRSKSSKKGKGYAIVFLENLLSLIDMGNSIEDEQQQEEFQLLTGIADIGDYLAFNGNQLKQVIGEFSNSSVHKYITIFCGPDFKGEARRNIIDNSFLSKDRFQYQRWSLRPQIKDELRKASKERMEQILSQKNKEFKEKYAIPKRPYRKRKNEYEAESNSNTDYETEDENDKILVRRRQQKQVVVPEESEDDSDDDDPVDEINQIQTQQLIPTTETDSELFLSYSPSNDLSIKLTDPIPVDYLFTNTYGTSCFR